MTAKSANSAKLRTRLPKTRHIEGRSWKEKKGGGKIELVEGEKLGVEIRRACRNSFLLARNMPGNKAGKAKVGTSPKLTKAEVNLQLHTRTQ